MSMPPPPPGSVPPPHGFPPGSGSGGQHSGFRPHGGQHPGLPPQPLNRGNGWKWALGAVSLIAVIGVSVAVTLSVVNKRDAASELATAPPL